MSNFLELKDDELKLEDITDKVSSPDCGAISVFIGTTRNSFNGKKVIKLEYEAFDSMALKEMEKICLIIREKWKQIKHIAIYHRKGEVSILHPSIIIAISSPHRRDSLEAVNFCIDEVKRTVPIWKKEWYDDSTFIWKENCECLNKSYMSSKIDKSISMITDLVNEFPDDKLIIVSQWTSVLSIIGSNLKKRNIEYCEIKGDVMLFRRNEIVEEFNDKSNTNLKVMLLSLTAGGVGLNLIGANRMFLLDIHWNPALEQQCADRIYRVGQTKNVTIYKLLCEETIEERIQQIQQTKIQIAERVCRSGAESAIPGVPGNAKLTIRDFKLLFQDFNTK